MPESKLKRNMPVASLDREANLSPEQYVSRGLTREEADEAARWTGSSERTGSYLKIPEQLFIHGMACDQITMRLPHYPLAQLLAGRIHLNWDEKKKAPSIFLDLNRSAYF